MSKIEDTIREQLATDLHCWRCENIIDITDKIAEAPLSDFKAALLADMLELVGEDELLTPVAHQNLKLIERNLLRQELRTKIKEYFNE